MDKRSSSTLRNVLKACIGVGVLSVTAIGCRDKQTTISDNAVTTIGSGRAVGRIPADGSDLLEIGTGYDSVSGEIRSRCIQEDAKSLSQPESAASSGSMKLDSLDSTDELAKAAGITASASFGTGVYSGDASVKYMSNDKMNKYSSYLLVSSFTENAPRLLHSYTLTKEARRALNRGLPVFVEMCGDQFVRGSVSGGDVSAVLSVTSTTEREQMESQAVIHAAGYGAKVEGTVENQLDHYQKTGRMHMDIVRHGPSESMPDASVEQLIQYAQTFPSKVQAGSKNAWVVGYVVSPYQEVYQHWNAAPEQISFVQQEQPYLAHLYSNRNDFKYVQTHRDQFGATSDAKLTTRLDELEREINHVKSAAVQCFADKSKCSLLTPIENPAAPDRGNAWDPLDPKGFTYRTLYTVVKPDTKVLEIKGSWYTQCNNPGAGIFGPTGWSVQLVSSKDLHVISDGQYPGHPMKIPVDTYVNVRVIDIDNVSAQDNCGVSGDAPMIRLFTPVFSDDY